MCMLQVQCLAKEQFWLVYLFKHYKLTELSQDNINRSVFSILAHHTKLVKQSVNTQNRQLRWHEIRYDENEI